MKTYPAMSPFPVSENVARMQSSATMAAVREQNYVFKPKTKQAWLTMFAPG